MMKATIGMLAVLGLLAACAAPAPTAWEKPGVSGAEVKKDAARCRAFASSEAERKYQRDNPTEDSGIGGPGSSFQNTMAANDAALFRNKVYNDCMALHGYQKMGAAKP